MLIERGDTFVGWATATIKAITEDSLSLEPHTEPGIYYSLDRWSNRLALSKSQTYKSNSWKSREIVGRFMKEIDAFDGNHWHKSTILSTEEIEVVGNITTLCHVAYRVYREPTANRNEWDS